MLGTTMLTYLAGPDAPDTSGFSLTSASARYSTCVMVLEVGTQRRIWTSTARSMQVSGEEAPTHTHIPTDPPMTILTNGLLAATDNFS